jgi:hypothetical protein
MINDEEILRKLLALGERFTTEQLDEVFLEIWDNTFDARLHCSSLRKRGYIDYLSDDEWRLEITEFEINEKFGSNGKQDN